MATYTDYKTFFDQEVWREIEETVKDIYVDCINGLKVAGSFEEVKYLQGQLKVCDFFMNLRDAMLEEARENELREKGE